MGDLDINIWEHTSHYKRKCSMNDDVCSDDANFELEMFVNKADKIPVKRHSCREHLVSNFTLLLQGINDNLFS